MAQSVYYSSQKTHADRNRAGGHGTLAAHALDYGIFARKENYADLGLLKVHGDACGAGSEIYKLVEHAVLKACN